MKGPRRAYRRSKQFAEKFKAKPAGSKKITNVETLISAFSGTAKKSGKIKVSVIDQLENPAGPDNDYFIAYYSAPLFIPETGLYRFSINSDDGGFLKINNSDAVAKRGPGNMEVSNRPLLNRWRRKKAVKLETGIHWLEFYHQELSGAQLARVGWKPPAWGKDKDQPLQNFMPAEKPEWQIIPAWALSGIIPSKLEILFSNKKLITVYPSHGLKLRRPEKRIHRLSLQKEEKIYNIRYFPAAGRYSSLIDEKEVYFWVDNNYFQDFSLQWEQGSSNSQDNFIKTMSFDLDIDLKFTAGNNPRSFKRHKKGKWIIWKIEDSEKDKDFSLTLGHIKLLSGRIKGWLSEEEPTASKTSEAEHIFIPAPDLISVKKLTEKIKVRLSAEENSGLKFSGISFDIWKDSPAVLRSLLRENKASRKGVILPLDELAYLSGITPSEIKVKITSLMKVICEAEAKPILLLDNSLNIDLPQVQKSAMAFSELRRTWKCRLIDLR
jgi:hypothetical protein